MNNDNKINFNQPNTRFSLTSRGFRSHDEYLKLTQTPLEVTFECRILTCRAIWKKTKNEFLSNPQSSLVCPICKKLNIYATWVDFCPIMDQYEVGSTNVIKSTDPMHGAILHILRQTPFS